MADPAVNAADPLFAVSKLELLLREYSELLKGAEEDVRSLRNELEMIDKVVQGLTRAPHKEKPIVRAWLSQVSELSDTRKVVDRFLTEVTPKNPRNCLLSIVSVLHRPCLKLASEMVYLKAFAIEVSERCMHYNVVPAATFTSIGSDNKAFQPAHVQSASGSQMLSTIEDFTGLVSADAPPTTVTQPAIERGVLDPSLEAIRIALLSTMSKLDERNQLKGVEGDIQELRCELSKMNEIVPALICKPQKPDPIALAWLNQVSELSGDTEDTMDRIIQEVTGNNTNCLLPIVTALHQPHRKLAAEILKLKTRAVEVNERCTRYNLAPVSSVDAGSSSQLQVQPISHVLSSAEPALPSTEPPPIIGPSSRSSNLQDDVEVNEPCSRYNLTPVTSPDAGSSSQLQVQLILGSQVLPSTEHASPDQPELITEPGEISGIKPHPTKEPQPTIVPATSSRLPPPAPQQLKNQRGSCVVEPPSTESPPIVGSFSSDNPLPPSKQLPKYDHHDPELDASFDEANVVGIHSKADHLASWLDEGEGKHSQNSEMQKVLCIVGMGGIGKTTLAKAIYRRASKNFEYRAFVVASQNFLLVHVLRQILSQVLPGWMNVSDKETWEEWELIFMIDEFLYQKRFLLFIDDLWREEDWNVLQAALPIYNSDRAIVTTTRDVLVARACCVGQHDLIYKHCLLDSDNALELLLRNIDFDRLGFSKYQMVEIAYYAYNICEKCDGLPLAIIATSRLLAENFTVGGKLNIFPLQSLPSEMKNNGVFDGLEKIFSLIYDDLPPFLQKCVLHLSIFPEGHLIMKNSLVRQWIGEEYVTADSKWSGENDISALEEVGEECFRVLLDRSIIIPVGIQFNGEVTHCKVHNIMLQLIIQKAAKENFVMRTPFCCDITPDSGNFSSLKVLYLISYKGFDDTKMESINQLVQLRYLGLEGEDITILPENVGMLCSLVTLELRRTSITELPSTISHLENLAHLVTYGTRHLCLPLGIGKMKSLQTLCGFNILTSPTEARQLKELTNLRQLSIIVGNYGAEYLIDVLQASLCVLELDLSGDCREGFLHKLSEFTRNVGLRSLILIGCIEKIPQRFGELKELVHLQLETDLGSDSFLTLGGLPNLMCLELNLPRICLLNFQSESLFQALRRLMIQCVVGMVLSFSKGALPNLEMLYLELKNAKDLRLHGIEELQNLREIGVFPHEEDDKLVADLKTYFRNHPNCPNITDLTNKEDKIQYFQGMVWKGRLISHTKDISG